MLPLWGYGTRASSELFKRPISAKMLELELVPRSDRIVDQKIRTKFSTAYEVSGLQVSNV